MKLVGRVHLVGAGPGDPDLITVKGRRLIERAEALVYDALVNEEMVSWAPPQCRRIFVGKRAGERSQSQESIDRLLVHLARSGLEVVRLKGGDPFIFGRGGEEAQALVEAGIPFTVVPAVTAALAASSHAGVPLTHRECSSSVTFLSGHEDPRKEASLINWKSHAQSGATLCLYMAMRRLNEICTRLEGEGLDGSTPAIAVEWAGTDRQRTVEATLATLPFEAERAGIGSPALVIIGRVASYASLLSWYSPHCKLTQPQEPSRAYMLSGG